MGSCASTPHAASSSPPPAVRAHSSSSRNITTASSPRPSSSRSTHAPHTHSNPHSNPNTRPNAPLKPIPPTHRAHLTPAPQRAWTRTRLATERADWWDTQVAGSPEIWGAVRLAAQHLQAGEVREAQTMLDVTGCTCPTGVLWGGVYDATGVQYAVPEWVVVEVEGVVEDEEGSGSVVEQESGKEQHGEIFHIKVRTSHNQRDVVLPVRQREPVATIVDKLKKHAELNPDTRIRLAYGGRLYQNHETLEAHPLWGFANAHVLVALIVL